MGLDQRISPEFLDAGVGYGGSCFPKDVKALAHMASMAGAHPQLLRAVMEINRDMRRLVLQKVRARARRPRRSGHRRARPGLQAQHRRPARGARHRDHPPAAVRRRARQGLRSGGERGRARRSCRASRWPRTRTRSPKAPTRCCCSRQWSEFRRLDLDRIRQQHAASAADRRSQPVRPARDDRPRLRVPRPSAGPRPKEHPCPSFAESTPEAQLVPR